MPDGPRRHFGPLPSGRRALRIPTGTIESIVRCSTRSTLNGTKQCAHDQTSPIEAVNVVGVLTDNSNAADQMHIAASAIAVGTQVTPRPPHRSERARFG